VGLAAGETCQLRSGFDWRGGGGNALIVLELRGRKGLARWVVALGGGLGDSSLAFRAPLAVCRGGLPKPLIPWKLGEIGFV
jgi:hypothetical protein